MSPQSGDGGSFVIPLSFKAFAEEVISQNTSLWEAITSPADLEVYPAISVPSLKVVFFNEFGRDV